MYSNYKANFQEQFEDSQQFAYQDSSPAGPVSSHQDGYPIQLIRIRPSGKIEIDQNALQIISQCDLPVGFVTLAGKYRTGKSFLLNKLLYLTGKGFRVDPSTTACTQGIWMWSKPVYNQRLGNYLFFIDTEGSQSLTKDIENDTKIFVLATLMSSYFMYNSVGSIDQKSINELNVVSKLSINILAEQNIRSKDNQDILFRFMPKFLWVLRDFTLQLQNYDGRKFSSKQYLEDCLLDQNTLIKTNEDSKKIRRAIVTYFKDRDCVTLVRPAKEERDLQRLDDIPEHLLRRQFIDGVNQIRDKIMKEAGPKTYEGTPLYGSSIASMIQSYVQSINKNGLPTIKTAWQHISQDEGVYAYNRALETYNTTYQTYFSEDEPKGQQIHKILINLRDETLTQFNKSLSQPNEPYLEKLKNFLAKKQEQILQVNRQLNDCRNIEVLKECASDLLMKIESNFYVNKPQQMKKDIETAVQRYKQKAKGENKGEILSEFLANMNPIILQIQNPKLESQESTNNIEKQQAQQRMRLLQQKLKSLQNQLTATNEENKKLKKAATQISKGPPAAKQPKKQSTGCCGTGSCSIM